MNTTAIYRTFHRIKFGFFTSLALSLLSTSSIAEEFTLPIPNSNTLVAIENLPQDPPPIIEHDDSISMDFLMGRFSASKHPDFTRVNAKYADRKGLYLHNETYRAFQSMYNDARKQGVRLVIRSATRSFYQQKAIWGGKWTGKRRVGKIRDITKTIPNPEQRALKILEYSSMPGSSRHHWGTEVDLNAFNNRYFSKGKGKKVYQWLSNNAHKYGFCQPYTAKNFDRPYGYNEEKWHWSYKPLAKQYSDQVQIRMHDGLIQGFKGANTAINIGIVGRYVLGVNPDCL